MPFDESNPDFAVFNEIIRLRRNWLGIQDWSHPRYNAYDYPQRLCILSDMNRVYILREIGDIEKFLELERKIRAMPGKSDSPQDKVTFDMAEWVDASIKSIKPFASEKPRIVLSLLAYGADYISKCLNIALKSLMSEENLPFLCKEMRVIFHVQTDENGRNNFESAPIVDKIKSLGAHFEYCIIPNSLMEQIDDTSVYWLVGAAATLGIEYARANNAAFHHTYPDIVYSNRFMSELFRLSKSHQSILSPAHRTDASVLLEALKPYKNDECISVPSPDLVAFSLNAIHMCHWPTIVNHRPSNWCYPKHHYLVWETLNSVHFNCPHLNAIWLSAETIAKTIPRFYISFDSELDFVCQGENYYIPQQNDDLYLVEFSNQGKQKVEDVYVDATNYAGFFWGLSTNRDNFKFFTRGMTLKINPGLRPVGRRLMEESNLMQEKVYLYNNIISKDPGVGTTLVRPRTHENRMFGITTTVHTPT